MVTITSLEGNRQKLDGGAMFGNAPRALWQRWCPPDELGRIDLACRCFLVQDGDQKILIEAGIGSFFEPKLAERFGVQESEHVLLNSLNDIGVAPADIDVVLLSHLHFDHAGGLLSAYSQDQEPELVFPRATFVVGETAWSRAKQPHFRDRASFIPQLIELLDSSGRLEIVGAGQSRSATLGESISLEESNGHTPGMLIPTVTGGAGTATFCADLIPGAPWVHLPITMGYDRFPEKLIDEKRELYERIGEGAWLLFTHDAEVAAGRLGKNEKGKFEVRDAESRLSNLSL